MALFLFSIETAIQKQCNLTFFGTKLEIGVKKFTNIIYCIIALDIGDKKTNLIGRLATLLEGAGYLFDQKLIKIFLKSIMESKKL
jgi:hypothetical protein